MPSYKNKAIRTRRSKNVIQFNCYYCKKEIEVGQKYYNYAGYDAHKECVELKDNQQ